MTTQEQLAIEQLKNRFIVRNCGVYGEDTESIINECYNQALSDYLLYKYPSDNNRPTPETLVYDFTCINWVSQRIQDILDRYGSPNATSYKENGISITWASSHIDSNLVGQLMPKASVPK